MRLVIHRGTNEIGGTCVEIKTDKTRILIDFGMPLVDIRKEPFDSKLLAGQSVKDLKKSKILPNITGLYNREAQGIDAILISHSHMDHYGLLNYVNGGIPVYMSRGAQELIKISAIFTPNKIESINSQAVCPGRTFSIGDITVTPYLVDHSAFDALAFLIQADGRRVFYSGDFRAHGRKSKLFQRILENPPKDINCLLMEGSMLGRESQKYKDEMSVQRRIEEILKPAGNITFLFASSQNIDRLVSAYKACLKTNTTFVIDIYTAYILDRLGTISKHIPQFNWRNLRVKFYKNQVDSVVEKLSKELLFHYNAKRIELAEINESKNKFLILARDNTIFPRIIKGLDTIRGAKIIYSMWDGYLTPSFKEYCSNQRLEIEKVHTSGHATVEDLKAFAKALNPGWLIPIHTFEKNRYSDLFQNVTVLDDEEEFEIV